MNSRIRTFGGTTTVWGGGWKPLDQIDFEKRDWVPFSGWPITHKDLVSYYERGASMFGGPSLKEFEIDKHVLSECKRMSKSEITVTNDAKKAVKTTEMR